MNRRLIALALALVFAALALVHPYGLTPSSKNSGIAIGLTESCQMGYEVTGTQGFFVYCDSPLFSIDHYEDDSYTVKLAEWTFAIDNPLQ